MIASLETAAQEEKPVTTLFAAVNAGVEQRCAISRQRMSSSTQPFEKEQASAFVKLNCDCLPAEVERAEIDLSAGNEAATTTKAAFLARLQVAFNSCAARLLRSEVVTRCAGESEDTLGVANKKAYCGCLSERLNALDDDTIATAAATKYNHFQEKVQARINGDPEPAPISTVVDSIELACKQASK